MYASFCNVLPLSAKKIMCKFADDWADAREATERQRRIEEDEFNSHLGKFRP